MSARTKARKRALDILYQSDIRGDSLDTAAGNFLKSVLRGLKLFFAPSADHDVRA